MEGLGGELRRWRAVRGLTLVEVARRSLIDRPTLWRWETEVSSPSTKALVRLLDVLEVAPEERTRILAEAAPRAARDELAHTALGSPVYLGQALRALRIRARLTQSQAATRLGATQATVARWESGAREPDGDALARALAALGASAQDAAWARSLIGREPIRFASSLDAKAWLDDNQPLPEKTGDLGLLAFEREVWGQAARDPRWERILAESMAWRSVAHSYAGDYSLGQEATRGALALAARLDAWDEAIASTVGGLRRERSCGRLSIRDLDRRYAEAYGRLRSESARLLCLYEWAWDLGETHPSRAEELLNRMRQGVTQETRVRAQDAVWGDTCVLDAYLRLCQNDPEGALEALAGASGIQRDVFYETLRIQALHLVEPGRPTEQIIRREYAAANSQVERERWRGTALSLGLPPPP